MLQTENHRNYCPRGPISGRRGAVPKTCPPGQMPLALTPQNPSSLRNGAEGSPDTSRGDLPLLFPSLSRAGDREASRKTRLPASIAPLRSESDARPTDRFAAAGARLHRRCPRAPSGHGGARGGSSGALSGRAPGRDGGELRRGKRLPAARLGIKGLKIGSLISRGDGLGGQ